MKRTAITMTVLLACAGLAFAGIRADLSGDAVVDFQTTMDMPLMTVGNPGNASNPLVWFEDRGDVAYVYWIGKFEVTAGQYTEFLNAVAATDTYNLYTGAGIQRSGSPGSYAYSVAADWEDRPVNSVSWGDSARFANWLTNGMPTGSQNLTTTEDGSYFLNGATSDEALLAVTRKSAEDGGRYYIPTGKEWYKAAYHKNDGVTDNYFFGPTSSDSKPSRLLIDPDPGNNANFYDEGFWTIGSPYYRTEVGEFENSESPYGTFDMGGNVQEWTETIYHTETWSKFWVWGGNYYDDHWSRLDARDGFTFSSPTYSSPYAGFRISEVPEPATLSLLGLGGLALLKRRRKWGAATSSSMEGQGMTCSPKPAPPTPADSGWHIETVDSTGDVGECASITLDAGSDAHIASYTSSCVAKRDTEERRGPGEQPHPVFKCTETKYLHRADALQIGTVLEENSIMKTKISILLVVLAVAHVSQADLVTVPQFRTERTEVAWWSVSWDSDDAFPGPPYWEGTYDGQEATLRQTIIPFVLLQTEYSGSFTCEEEELEYVYLGLSWERWAPYSESGIQSWEHWETEWEWNIEPFGGNAYWEYRGDWAYGSTDVYEFSEVWEAVPEPATLCLLALGGLALLRKRTK